MKIKAIETYPVRIPLKEKYRMVTNLGVHNVSDYVLTRVVADNDMEGVGEATVMPRWSGETMHGAKAIIDRLFAPLLAGFEVNSPSDIAGFDEIMDKAAAHNWFAKAAIEMALWDLLGKQQGRPVYELLGGPARPPTVECRFSLGAYEPERAAARVKELLAEGFRTIKVKVGTGAEQDIARVRAVREVMGPDLPLVLDANCGWDADTAIACLAALKDCNVGLMEQPTPDGDYLALARVRREAKVPVLADDICFNLVHAQQLIHHECCDAISVYPGKNGGIGKSRRIVEYAQGHGVACSIGSNLEWDVGAAAMAHLVRGLANMQVEKYPGDMLGPSYHEFGVVTNPIKIEGPHVTAPSGPGLGVEVDWGVVKANRVD